ncbi:DUF6808 domain-containing protein [Paramuribaculum intestinale]|uniref:DUF6808 domain-containing protein n=1 Tax=Paramuribaculum intestinale TaxID=2094151 RepID=UPI0025B0E54F|nr:hypothetical protein [Paramuribaculum intestinale]
MRGGRWIMAVVVVAILMAASWSIGRMSGDRSELRETSADTTRWTDTVKAVSAAAVKTEVADRVVKRLPLAGVGCKPGGSELSESSELSEVSKPPADSVDVSVAMERKVYTDSSTYRAVISGAWVNLDTIEVWNRHESVSVIRRESVRAKRWSVGVGVGYGWNGRGWSPYAGVTVSYKLWEF